MSAAMPTVVPMPGQDEEVLVREDSSLWEAARTTLIHEGLPMPERRVLGYYVLSRSFVDLLNQHTSRVQQLAENPVFSDYAKHREQLLVVARDRWIAYDIGWLERADRRTFDTDQECITHALARNTFASSLIIHVGHEAYTQPGFDGVAI